MLTLNPITLHFVHCYVTCRYSISTWWWEGEPAAHLQNSTDISDNLLSVFKISCAFPLTEEI